MGEERDHGASEKARRVYREADGRRCFADLDVALGVTPPRGDSSLESWYRERRLTAISELELADLCRALRQQIHLPLIAPRAASDLERRLWAGSAYPGELLAAMTATPRSFIAEWPVPGARLRELGRRALREGPPGDDEGLDPELWAEISGELRAWLERIEGPPTRALVLTVEAGAGVNRPVSLALTLGVELTIGSAPSATISRPQPRSGLARTQAIAVLNESKSLTLDTLHHGGELNGVPFIGAVELSPGDHFTLGALGFRFHWSGEPPVAEERHPEGPGVVSGERAPVAAPRPRRRQELLAGVDYLMEAAAQPFSLGGETLNAVYQLFDAIRRAASAPWISTADVASLVAQARALRAALAPDEPLASGSYLATLFELVALIEEGALDRAEGEPVSPQAPIVTNRRLERLGLPHLKDNPEALRRELESRLAKLAPDLARWHEEQRERFAEDFASWPGDEPQVSDDEES